MIKNFTHYCYKTFLSLISPPFCAHCREFLEVREPLCTTCKALIKPIVSTEILLTKNYSLKVFALAHYENPLQLLIRAKSYSNRVASVQLGELMSEQFPDYLLQADYLVPVPLHWTRYAWRGYNQAEVMAEIIGKKYNKKVVNLLSRDTRTTYQAQLSADLRYKNVAQVFSPAQLNNHELYNKNLVLIDDLMTTGSTLKAAGRELLHYKPASISAFVTCRVV